MSHLGAFAEVFGYTPTEYRALTYRDYHALVEYLVARERAANAGR